MLFEIVGESCPCLKILMHEFSAAAGLVEVICQTLLFGFLDHLSNNPLTFSFPGKF